MKPRVYVVAAAACAALGAGVVGAATSPGGSSSPPTCERASGTTVLANERARVFKRSGRLLACAAGSRRLFTIGRLGDDCDSSSGTCSGLGNVALAGRFVAYEEVELRRDSGGSAVYRVDLKRYTERLVWEESGTIDATATTDLEVTPRGSVGWIALRTQPGTTASASDRRVFRSLGAAAPEQLDSGAGIGADSLAASGGQLYWTNAGVARSAPVK